MRDFSTVVFTDLTGSSAVYEALGCETAADAVNAITQWIGRVFEAHGGRVVKYLGDGVMAVFPRALQAVSASILLQKRYYEARQGWRVELQDMRLKIGMASGAMVLVGDDVLGEPVNLAARLCDMAGSDAIWAHEMVFEQVRSDAPTTQAALLQEQVQLMAADEIHHRWLGSMPVPGLSAPQPVMQVFWNSEFELSQLTEPGALQALQTDADPSQAPSMGVWTLLLRRNDVDIRLRGLPGQALTIGRAVDQGFVVGDQRVSRRHARIEWSRDGFALTDLSSYGTWVRYGGGSAFDIVALRRSSARLLGSGTLALGVSFDEPSPPTLDFELLRP